jgi:hypothetical protein
MKRNITFFLAIMCASVVFATPVLQWGITSSTSPSDVLGGLTGTALAGSKTDPLVGCYIQLLWTGANGLIDDINLSNLDGHGGDDVVVARGYVGYGTGLGTTAGYFYSTAVNGASVSAYTVGVDAFYMRTWNAPVTSSGNYTSGYAPLSTATYYGNSATHVLADSPTYDDWKLTSGFDTTIAVVPEPTTIALFGIGLALIGFRRFKKC